MFPKVQDHHKKGKPLVPNGLGIVYVLLSALYLFMLPLFLSKDDPMASWTVTFAVSVMFGGFIGVCDDWLDIRWRYKALLPLMISIPLVVATVGYYGTTAQTFIFGLVEFGVFYYILYIPLFTTVVTNTINQLGGLNGLETIPPAIIMAGLMLASGHFSLMLVGPLIALVLLAIPNAMGKIFVGNVGSFAVGTTIAAFAVLSNLKTFLIVALIPYIFNSALILLSYFFTKSKANMQVSEGGLTAEKPLSLLTMILYRRRLTERKTVAIASLITAAFTALAFLTLI